MKKKLPTKLPPVIPAPKELRDAMRRLSQMPPVSLTKMLAQTTAMLRIRSEADSGIGEHKGGSARKAV